MKSINCNILLSINSVLFLRMPDYTPSVMLKLLPVFAIASMPSSQYLHMDMSRNIKVHLSGYHPSLSIIKASD